MTKNRPEKTLLLTGTPARPDGVGGIILADLCSFFPEGRLCVAYCPEGRGDSSDARLDDGTPVRTFPVDYRRGLHSRFGRAGRVLQWLRQSRANRSSVRRQADACIEWSRLQGVQEVWAILDSPVTVELAGIVASALGVPLRVTVWDDVHHNVDYFGLDRPSARRIVSIFERTLRQSVACAVIGETMKQEYEALYGVKAVIVRHGLAPEAVAPDGEGWSQRAAYSIGFAGSVTAVSAFNTFLAALDAMGWQFNGRPIVLRLLGHRFDLKAGVPRNIEYFGWRSVKESVRLLSECSFNYLPQAFEANWLPFSRLSFPSKLTTYLGASVPLLLHAPEGASLPAFLEKHPFGIWCSSLQAADVEKAISSLLAGESASLHVAAGREALETEFTRSNFRRQFALFLDVDPNELCT